MCIMYIAAIADNYTPNGKFSPDNSAAGAFFMRPPLLIASATEFIRAR